MPCKSVFCIIGTDRCDRDIMNAINLCNELNAHLSVLVVGLTPVPMGGYGTVLPDAWTLEREADVAAMKAREQRVRSLAIAYGVSTDVDICYVGERWADEMIGQRARYSDLTVVGPDLLCQPDLKTSAIEGVLFHSGSPILILPADAAPSLRPRKVLFAWDSRMEAMRAARAAIDVLAGAIEVHVTIVEAGDKPNESIPVLPASIAAYLARHGAKVTTDRLLANGRAATEVIRQHAADIFADLIVMGAYGHSRLRERVFGGVTGSMIDAPPLPVFMMH
jgi:nucleotide-binding universal stress UspA family protein